jgi:hypothetical protein
MTKAQAVRRGCGTRRPGLYLECDVSPYGRPIEDFLIDPPLTVGAVPAAWLAPHRTPLLVEHDGVWHVVHWVGEVYYPSAADFWEEVRVAGSSRRIPPHFDLTKLTAQSRQFFVHARAYPDASSTAALIPSGYAGPLTYGCPSHHHWPPEPHCLQFVRQYPVRDAEGYATVERAPGRVRTLPCGHAYALGPAVLSSPLAVGVFLALPITGVCIVQQPEMIVNPTMLPVTHADE